MASDTKEDVRPVVRKEPRQPRWRVSLPGLKVRSVDDKGRVVYQEHLDVEARSEPDAFQAFKAFNGIISSTQTPAIERLPD